MHIFKISDPQAPSALAPLYLITNLNHFYLQILHTPLLRRKRGRGRENVQALDFNFAWWDAYLLVYFSVPSYVTQPVSEICILETHRHKE